MIESGKNNELNDSLEALRRGLRDAEAGRLHDASDVIRSTRAMIRERSGKSDRLNQLPPTGE